MKKRKTYLDVLRIIAIYFVLYVHTENLAAFHYLVPGDLVSYWTSLAIHQFSFICNNTFFVITGALLLGKSETLKDIFKKRVVKYLVIILIFGFLQYCHTYHHYPEIGFDMKIIFKILYSENVITQYWFLHAYLAFLLILPFMRAIVQNISGKLALYLVGGFLLIDGILPLIELLWENERIALEIPMFVNIIIYPILGYFLDKFWYEKIVSKKLSLWVNVAGLAAWALNIWYCKKNMDLGVNFKAADGLTMLMVVMVYVDVRLLCDAISKAGQKAAKGEIKESAVAKIIALVGRGTIVIYLLNNVLSENTRFIYDALVNKISWLGAVFIWLNAAIILGTLISMAYFGLKKLLFFRAKKA